MVKGCTKTAKSLYDAEGKKAKKECAKIREDGYACLLYTSPSPRDYAASRMPSSA